MMRKYLIIISCLSVLSPAAFADDKDKTLYAAAPASLYQWQETSLGMQPGDYQRSTRQNQAIVQQGLAAWASRELATSGDFGPVAGLLGATLSLAANDRRYHLNKTRTLGVVIRDSARSNRALLFEYRKNW